MATNVKPAAAKTTAKAEVKKTVAKPAAKTAVKVAPKAAPKTAAKVAPKTEVKKVAAKAPVAPKAVKAPKAKAVKQDVARINRRKVLRGVVISNKMDKTGVVEITRKVPHPLYKKVVTKTSRFKFHDENNECSIGDTIEVMETRPLSKDKYFRLVRIVEKVK